MPGHHPLLLCFFASFLFIYYPLIPIFCLIPVYYEKSFPFRILKITYLIRTLDVICHAANIPPANELQKLAESSKMPKSSSDGVITSPPLLFDIFDCYSPILFPARYASSITFVPFTSPFCQTRSPQMICLTRFPRFSSIIARSSTFHFRPPFPSCRASSAPRINLSSI